MMRFTSKENQVAHFSRIDFLLDRWGGAVWPLKINESPYSKVEPARLVEWCAENGFEFGYKRDKIIYFANEGDLTLFKIRWVS